MDESGKDMRKDIVKALSGFDNEEQLRTHGDAWIAEADDQAPAGREYLSEFAQHLRGGPAKSRGVELVIFAKQETSLNGRWADPE